MFSFIFRCLLNTVMFFIKLKKRFKAYRKSKKAENSSVGFKKVYLTDKEFRDSIFK